MNRRDFLRMSSAGTLLAAVPQEMLAQSPQHAAAMAGSGAATWDPGKLLHLLPTVSDREMIIKASVDFPLGAAPVLRVGSQHVVGQMTDTRGEHWQFHAKGLEPGRRYRLLLVTGGKSGGKPLWMRAPTGCVCSRSHARVAMSNSLSCRLQYAIACCAVGSRSSPMR